VTKTKFRDQDLEIQRGQLKSGFHRQGAGPRYPGETQDMGLVYKFLSEHGGLLESSHSQLGQWRDGAGKQAANQEDFGKRLKN
jgi:hypothetical protein